MSHELKYLVLACALGLAVPALAQVDPDDTPADPGAQSNAAAARGLARSRTYYLDGGGCSFPRFTVDGTDDCTNTTYYGYDAGGDRVTERSETDNNFDGIPESILTGTYEYDAGGRLVRREYGSELELITYDRSGRILTRDFSASGFVENAVWFRDERGRPLMRNVVQISGGAFRTEIDYAYAAWDAHANPTQWAVQTRTFSRAGDGGWTLSSRSVAAVTATYTGRGQQLTERTLTDAGADGTVNTIASRAFSYDQRGNMLSNVLQTDTGADGTINRRDSGAWTYDDLGNKIAYMQYTDVGVVGTLDNGDFGSDEAFSNNVNGYPVTGTLAIWRRFGGVIQIRQSFQTTWAY